MKEFYILTSAGVIYGVRAKTIDDIVNNIMFNYWIDAHTLHLAEDFPVKVLANSIISIWLEEY